MLLAEVVMPNQLFARVEWDAEAARWYVADSNVPGLVGEAPTLEAMMALLHVRVPEMLEENGWDQGDQVPFELVTAARLAEFQSAA